MNNDIISRPCDDGADELLTDHSEAVGNRAPELSTYPSENSLDGYDIARCVGYLHDLGKATTYFQRHVRNTYVENKRLTYHARLGAFAVFHALDQMGASDGECLSGMLAVFRHHGRLPDAAERLVRIVKEERTRTSRSGYAVEQVTDIDAATPNRTVADELLRRASQETASWASFEAAITDGTLFDTLIDLAGESGHRPGLEEATPDRLPPHLYDSTLHLWSALTLADKTSAARIDDQPLRPSHLDLDGLDDHIHLLREGLDDPPVLSPTTTMSSLAFDVTDDTSLNQLREAVRRLVRDNAESFASSSSNIATLTLPTGLGKTFTGLTAAYTVRDTLRHDELSSQTRPRVVYALPYTSIIEQTRELFEAEHILNADPKGLAFTVHHYLSETVSYPEIEHEQAGDQATDDQAFFDPALLGESWRSGTILTTFVQLFESLTAPTNARGLKLPALTDSIIILDEPQTLPPPWWEAIRRLTTLLVERYNARVISMTATQPSLFTDASAFETVALLGEPESDTPPVTDTCFEAVERVQYGIDDSVRSFREQDEHLLDVETAGTRLFDAAVTPMPTSVTEKDGGASILAVCNTVASTQALTDAVVTAAQSDGWNIRRIGAAYRESLHTCSPHIDVNDDPLPSHRPDTDVVAEATLHEFGFRPVDPDSTAPLSKQRWRPRSAASSSNLYIGAFTSRLRPRDRRALVTIANVLARAGVPFVFVSTQAVEAGVDISFARVYRDLAPLDSIVQAAGRCNRSFEWGHSTGRVTVWALDAIEGTNDPPATYVYQPKSLLTAVASILDDCCSDLDTTVLSESVLTRTAVPEYYTWIEQHDLEKKDLAQWIERCQAEQLQRAHLIDDSYEKYDVLVAETVLEQSLLSAIGDSFGNVADQPRYDLLKAVSDLRVSIPADDIETIRGQVHRLDRQSFDADGVSVLMCPRTGSPYDLAAGGFIVTDDDGLAGRFTYG